MRELPRTFERLGIGDVGRIPLIRRTGALARTRAMFMSDGKVADLKLS
jgi:hypothetical protein